MEGGGGSQAGWVYFIRCTRTNLIKIGFTTSGLAGRMATLQTGSSSRLLLVGAVPGTRDTEVQIHRRFADCRMDGEWFRQTPALFVWACRNLEVFPELLPSEEIEAAREFARVRESLGVTLDRWLNDIECGDYPIPEYCP